MDDGSQARQGAPGIVERLWEGRLGRLGRVLDVILAPAELAFRGLVAARDRAYRAGVFRTRSAPAPTISVGNLTVGGTGKTPMVRWLVERLVERGRRPGILHGGYSDDEPALHRHWFPTLPVVARRDRVSAADHAVEAGADVLVLDDGFQHRRIDRQLDVVLVAAETWTPSPRLLPRGPYREPPRALDRAGVVVVTRRRADAAAAGEAARAIRAISGSPVAVAYLEPGAWLDPEGRPRAGRPERGVAVAGIGQPDAFFDPLRDRGIELTAALAFRDHHDYGAEDVAEIRRAAGSGPVLTTAKDAVKLGPLLPDTEVWVLDLRVVFEEGRDALVAAMEEALR